MSKDNPDALTVVTRLLAGRDKTRAQLVTALEQRGFSPAQTTAALQRAESLGYLNEARVARQRAEAGLAEGWAGQALAARLEAAGLSETTAAQAIANAIAERGWTAMAAAADLVQRRRLTGAKAARFLSQRGFEQDVVERLVGTGEVER